MKKLLLGLMFLLSTLTAKDISAYLYGKLETVNNIKTALATNGLETIGEYYAMGNKDYHVIVYTSRELKQMAMKENREFAAVQKVLIDLKDKKLVFTNPNYFLRAFMQDDLDNTLLQVTNSRLNKSFSGLENGVETLDEDNLEDYHFMFGMPYYSDMIEVASGDNLKQTLQKNAKDKIVFKLSLGNSTLYGVSMDTKDGEKSYIPAIGQEKNSAFLPYLVVISNGKAKILHAKYYLAISLPKLSMGEFMTISDAPGNIEDFFESLFVK